MDNLEIDYKKAAQQLRSGEDTIPAGRAGTEHRCDGAGTWRRRLRSRRSGPRA